MFLKLDVSKLKIERELRLIELTQRNRALLASYLRDRPVEYRAGINPREDMHHIKDLYKVIPNSTRGNSSGVWFYDVSNIGENLRRLTGRNSATFHVCEARMAGAEVFWREDLKNVMISRSPVVGRFSLFTGTSGFEIEHLALPVLDGRRIASIIGAFDLVDGGMLSEQGICWPDVKRVQRLYDAAKLQNVLKLRRGSAGKVHGAFHGVFHVLPASRPYWFHASTNENSVGEIAIQEAAS